MCASAYRIRIGIDVRIAVLRYTRVRWHRLSCVRPFRVRRWLRQVRNVDAAKHEFYLPIETCDPVDCMQRLQGRDALTTDY